MEGGQNPSNIVGNQELNNHKARNTVKQHLGVVSNLGGKGAWNSIKGTS